MVGLSLNLNQEDLQQLMWSRNECGIICDRDFFSSTVFHLFLQHSIAEALSKIVYYLLCKWRTVSTFIMLANVIQSAC